MMGIVRKYGALLALLFIFPTAVLAEDVWVDGYYRSNGTYVAGHYRSRPNAYQWDNKNYEPSQPAYNPSYDQQNRNYNSNWYEPSETRYQDSNSHNDYAPTQSSGIKLPQKRYGR